MEDWIGRGTVVTRVNSDTGIAITKKLVDMGVIVVGLDTHTKCHEKLKGNGGFSEDQFHYLKVDFTSDEDILEAFQMVEDFVGGANFLININLIFENASLLDSEKATLKMMAKSNIIAPTLCCREFVRSASDRNISLGHIINISSLNGEKLPKKSQFHFYAGTKAATNRLHLHLRQELEFKESSIKVTNICVDTLKISENENDTGRAFNFIKSEDIADAVEFLIKTSYHVQVRDIWIQNMKTNELQSS